MVDTGEAVNLPLDFGATMRGISKVNLRGGVVGKVALTVMIVCLSIALVAWSVHNIWISASALLAISVIAFTMLWRLISFADRHPQAALLEGAEFLVHEQIVQGTKKDPQLIIDPRDRMQPSLPQDHLVDQQAALEPDTEVGKLEAQSEEGQG
jgi:hypothetical protein